MSYNTVVNVRMLQVISNSSSSIIQAGESRHVTLTNRSISVERNNTRFTGRKIFFSQFELFTRPIPPLSPLFEQSNLIVKNIPEQNLLTETSITPHITIGKINVRSNSGSSYIHLGNSITLNGICRSKSFDQYIRKSGCKK